MRAAWLEIDLEAYRANLRAVRAAVDAPLLAIVKGNAYGHGLVRIAGAALDAGCWGLGVGVAVEAIALRRAGVKGEIIVLGLSLPDEAGDIVEHDLHTVISSTAMADALAGAAWREGKPARVHVKVDTGMTRAGLDPEAAIDLCRRIWDLPGVELAGVMTHFAAADDPARAREQWELFQPICKFFSAWPHGRPRLHAANSACCLWFRQAALDLARPGIVTFGVLPADGEATLDVRPVLSLKARLVQVREVPAGRAVSYGGDFVTRRASRLAIAPVGYGDGLPWRLSNAGAALVRGELAPIRGRVCMDQVVLDVTQVPQAGVGDEAVFIGRQGDRERRVADLAREAGTIPYEVLTGLSVRLPRRYSETEA